LYCYESVDGFVTMVACTRHVGEIPETDDSLLSDAGGDASAHRERIEVWLSQRKRQHDWLQSCQRAPIGGPHDGATFVDATLEEFLDRLMMLRGCGYLFPDSVIAEVDSQLKDTEAEV